MATRVKTLLYANRCFTPAMAQDAVAKFEEAKHPRDHGKFATNEGESARNDGPPDAKVSLPVATTSEYKRMQEAEIAQTKLGQVPTPKLELVPISRLIATQSRVNTTTIKRHLKEGWSPSDINEYNGKFYIIDGHHRVEAAI